MHINKRERTRNARERTNGDNFQHSRLLSFKSFGGRWCHKINLPSCVARRPLCLKIKLPSFAARRPLCHKFNLPRCQARRRHFIMTCDIFGTGQTNILSLCLYLFGKTYKQPTGAPLRSQKSTHSAKLLHLLNEPYDITSLQDVFIMIHSLNGGLAVRSPYV